MIDDSKLNRTIAQRMLEISGFQVEQADGGPEAIECVKITKFDVILVDYNMPEMDGPAVIRALRDMEETDESQFVVLTAKTDEEAILEAFRAGAHDFMSRPINWHLLTARVRAAIEHGKVLRESVFMKAERQLVEAQLSEARTVQQRQLPDLPRNIASWRIDGGVQPSGHVGGDTFTIIQTESGRTVVALVDVCGHGIASALVAAEVCGQIGSLVEGKELVEVVNYLSRNLSARSSKYIALGLVELRNNEVAIVNAGLPPIAHVRTDGERTQVPSSGPPPGLVDILGYEETVIPIKEGERICLCSDGLTEAFGYCDDLTALFAKGLVDKLPRQEGGPTFSELIGDVLGDDRDDDASLLVIRREAVSGLKHRTFPARTSEIREAVDWVTKAFGDLGNDVVVNMGITEAITNAVVHGTLGAASKDWHQDTENYLTRCNDDISDEKIEIWAGMNEAGHQLRIRWNVHAFRPEKRHHKDPDALLRGIDIIEEIFDTVVWSDDGFQIDLTKKSEEENELCAQSA